jgi:hypothetical protein
MIEKPNIFSLLFPTGIITLAPELGDRIGGIFRLSGVYLLWPFSKYYRITGYFFVGKSGVLILTKKWAGLHFGLFFSQTRLVTVLQIDHDGKEINSKSDHVTLSIFYLQEAPEQKTELPEVQVCSAVITTELRCMASGICM